MSKPKIGPDGLTDAERKLEYLLMDIENSRYQALVVILGARGSKCVKEMTEYILSKRPKTVDELVDKFLQSEIIDD